MKKFIFLFLLFFAFSSCSTVVREQNITAEPPINKIEKNKIIFIAKVSDGTFNGKVYAGSGNSVANSFYTAVGRNAANIILGSSDNYADEVKNLKADYIFRPIISHWEPRNAAWSGIPTKVTIIISVIDVKSGNILINKELSIRGRAVTFASQSAEGLAKSLINDFCAKIF